MPSDQNAANSGVIEHGDVPFRSDETPKPKPPPRKKPSGNGQRPPTAVPVVPPVVDASPPVPPAPPKPIAKQPVKATKPPAPQPSQAKQAPGKPAAKSVAPASKKPEPAEWDEERDERATAPSWQQMVLVYGVSMVLHAAVLVILGLIMLPQDVREEILSVIVKEEKPIEPPPIETLVEEPEVLEPEALEDTETPDANELVESDTEAEDKFKLDLPDIVPSVEPEASEGPSLPVPVGDISAGRSEATRQQMLAARGGNEASDAAVGYALEWLASVQRRDGSWDFNDVGKSTGAGNLSSPTGATGLALMAFLGAGHTHMKESKHQDNVKRGLGFLMRSAIRDSSGLDFRGQSPGKEGMYVQAIVATALAEALGMTKDRRLLPFAQGATNFIVRAQHPTGGGWRYRPRQVGDTSVVGWQVMALKSAYHSKIPIPRTVGMGVNKFLEEVSHERGSQYSYTRGHRPKASTTSIGLLCRMYMGWKIDNPALIAGVKYLASVGPSKGDIYYDYYASQVMIQFTGARGDMWDKWNTTMRDWLVETQVKTGPAKGSWDVIENGHKGDRGGRLYTTCLAVMTLEIYYRVLPLYQRSAVEGNF